MTAEHSLVIDVGHDGVHFIADDFRLTKPIGIGVISREICVDPPLPEELVNAIGIISDHVDDVVRELPDELASAQLVVSMTGAVLTAIAAVEVGSTPQLPFRLHRAAAEDVFRTVATEARADRACNPGLDPTLVDSIVAGCCVVVGVMRSLELDAVTVV
jgi:exopolyphosphatase / guanosine-5'-triphosphate,3'-diphosphate pyrophosphatase